METAKINWANTFEINESLHSTAQELSGVYSRLCINNPTHTDVNNWQKKSIEWANYDRAIKDMVFDSEAKALDEVRRLASECKTVLAFEKILFKENPK